MARRTDRRRTSEPAPTLEYIQALKRRAEEESTGVRKHWQEIREVRNGTYQVPVPDRFGGSETRKIRTRRVGDTIRRVKSTLTRNFPAVQCPPGGASNTQQDASSRREDFLNAGLLQLDSANQPERTLDAGMDYSVTYGQSWWKLVYKPDYWFGEPTAKSLYGRKIGELKDAEIAALGERRETFHQQRLPFSWTAPDPMSTWGFYRDRELSQVIEWNERPIDQLVRDYKVRYVSSEDGGQLEPDEVGQPFEEGQAPPGSQTLVFVEHWTSTWVTYVAGNTILDQFRHRYGRVPYFPFLGLSNYTQQPGARGESVVEHVIDMERELDAVLSMKHQWGLLSAYAMGVNEADDSNAIPPAPEGTGEEQTGPEFSFEAGKMKTNTPGYHFKWLEAPPVGKDLNDQILYLDRTLSQVVPDVMKGISAGNDQPGYAIYQLSTAARLVYDPLSENAAVALTAMVEFWQYLIENRVQDTVYVMAQIKRGDVSTRKVVSLSPDDLKGNYKVIVNMAALLPSNRQMEVQMGLAMFQANVITWRTFLEEYAHMDAPEREMRAKLRELATYDPKSPLFAWAMQEALQEAGLQRRLEKQQEAQALQGVPELPGVEEEMAMDQQLEQGAAGQVEVPGQPTIPPPGGPPMPATVGAGGVAGPTGGLVAGAPRMPNTQLAPGGGLEGA